jgi:hypothetical protein
MTRKSAPSTKTRLIPVSKWNDFHPWPTVSALRTYVFLRKRNGFEAVLKRVGRRLLIDESAFFAWVEARSEGCRE